MKFSQLISANCDLLSGNPNDWKFAHSHITGSNGDTVFRSVLVPDHWSQTATDILVQKYFRKTLVPDRTVGVEENSIPDFLQRQVPDKGASFGGETSAYQVFHRLAGCWTYWGWKLNVFDSIDDALAFYKELFTILALQIAAPNSPQWFNTGLHWAYGITGDDNGQWVIDPVTHSPHETKYSYTRPQVHACFIQSLSDNLVNANGIFDLVTREARLFKFGSGTGSNFSNIRSAGEKLSSGGTSSGLMSFLKIFDSAAGAIKSGGTTRRAAKMVCLDIDHPEIQDFINWKFREENKARILAANGIPLNDAIETIGGQNSNNSIRITDEFMAAVKNDSQWPLHSRTTNEIVKHVSARELWNDICTAAWHCGDPGVQFHDTINEWNTCKNDADINASNPCGEYNFLDDTACNLASINLIKFIMPDGRFDVSLFSHTVRILTTVLDISIDMASYPSREIAIRSHDYRTLGLGYANLGGLLMRRLRPYDSDEGRSYAAAITALMHGVAYKTSAELAAKLGPFPRFKDNAACMKDVIERHTFEALSISSVNKSDSNIHDAIREVYSGLSSEQFRNAQVTLLAPTGTIALLMDCDTTGIEPAFALKTHKKLVGGGSIESLNQSAEIAYQCLGLEPGQEIPDEFKGIFATAVGDNALSPEAHVKMVAAVQPFLSGGVSKTVNMPHDSTIEDVQKIYRLAYNLNLKSISIYRDGCKIYQPLTAIKPQSTTQKTPNVIEPAPVTSSTSIARRPLPNKRRAMVQKAYINGQKIYLITGEYEDGSLGEIFCQLAKEGSTARALMEGFSKAVSIALQYGVPLEEFVDAFLYTQFEPRGIVSGHENIKLCSSILDYIVRDLGIRYLNRPDLGQVKWTSAADNIITLEELMSFIEPQANETTSGEFCPECGAQMMQTGSCFTCSQCGNNTGCG
jgi:ribonucleoside-diphosphate reductase alpha chain